MTAKPSLWTRLTHAVFGRPLSHEEAQARRDAEIATQRSAASFEHQARARSVQNQTPFGMP